MALGFDFFHKTGPREAIAPIVLKATSVSAPPRPAAIPPAPGPAAEAERETRRGGDTESGHSPSPRLPVSPSPAGRGVGNARTLTQAELLAVIPAVAEEITQDVLLRAWLRADFADTKSRLELGRLAYHYSRAQASRPEALAEFRKLLQSKGFQGPLLRVGEFIRAYWVAQVYGFEAAQKLRYSTLRALMSTLQRNGTTGTYEQKHRCAKNAKQLWEQIQERNLSAAAVQSAVEKMLPRTARKKHGADAKRRAFLRLLKKLERLEGDEVVAALALLQRRVEEQSANQSRSATPAEPPRSAAA